MACKQRERKGEAEPQKEVLEKLVCFIAFDDAAITVNDLDGVGIFVGQDFVLVPCLLVTYKVF